MSDKGGPDVLSMTPGEMENWLSGLGEPGFRGRQLFHWLWRSGVDGWGAITEWPVALRDRLNREVPVHRLRETKREVAVDGTAKLLLALADGQQVETVLLPHPYGYSVCVSSQVGCRMGCTFCASGLSGKLRDLSAGEMLDQVRLANQLAGAAGHRVSRIDLMGIGEPLDNYANMVKFLRLAHEPAGLNVSYRHMTVSTSGLVPAIHRLAEEGLPVTLAVSLHAPDDALRRQLMPVNRAYPLARLLPACRDYSERTGRRVTFEYAMLSGVNDRPEDAQQLVALLAGFSCHVNLIPWNPVPEHPYTPSSPAVVRRFRQVVQEHGISCTIRRELGQQIDAACGQLRRREEATLRS